MDFRRRYINRTIDAAQIRSWQEAFFAAGGPALRLMAEMSENVPNVSLTLKNADLRIMFTNAYNVRVSGWRTVEDMLGYTSQELYPPDQAAVYTGRDREVLDTGIPIVERVYGFVADRSTALNCVTVRPIDDGNGQRIGTATVYYRADRKMKTTNWYDPIRKAVVYLNDHVSEDVSVEQLAAVSHYSVAQFRRLFRALTQMSPSDYIRHTRLNAAKTLLMTTDRRITDIAQETGFYDHAHFIRTFKADTGYTPAQYRARVQKSQPPTALFGPSADRLAQSPRPSAPFGNGESLTPPQPPRQRSCASPSRTRSR